MAQRQFRSDDTIPWREKYGTGSAGPVIVSADSNPSNANAGCSGTSGTTSLTIDAASTFSNGDIVKIIQSRGTGVGAWEYNVILSGAGTTTLTMKYPLCNTYTDSGASQAQIIQAVQATTVTINNTKALTANGWDGNKAGHILIFAKYSATVTGSLIADSLGYRGSTYSTMVSLNPGYQGEGTVGAYNQSTATNGNGGGAGLDGSGAKHGGGGGGGHASAGSNGQTLGTGTGGDGGLSSGAASLVTMTFGGAGGTSVYQDSSLTGGFGGGIIEVVSPSITVTGAISAKGQSPSGAGKYGSGAGAGGSILFKGKTIVLGSGLVTATGGTGAQGVTEGGDQADGGNGSAGRIHADVGSSITGTTNPTIDSRIDKTLTPRRFFASC